MGNICQGEEVDFKEMRTEEQKQMMSLLAGLISGGMQQGATPFPGQRNAPPDPGQMAAMNTMMGIGGYGPYTYGPSPYGNQPPMGMPTPFPMGGPVDEPKNYPGSGPRVPKNPDGTDDDEATTLYGQMTGKRPKGKKGGGPRRR